MEKISVEMDLDDWEFLPDTGLFDDLYHHGNSRSRKGNFSREKSFDSKGVVRPFPTSVSVDAISSVLNDKESMIKNKELEISKVPFIDISMIPPINKDVNLVTAEPDQETVSRVFFKKMKDNEFNDMKMDSPRSNSSKGLKLLTESAQFEDKEEIYKGEFNKISEVVSDQGMEKESENMDMNIKKESNWEGSLNIWGWKVNGVGALCCIGAAAATTICIVIFGSRRGNKNHHNHKIQFTIHPDDKKIKQVVQHEHILAQAIEAARAVPLNLNGSHIFFGDY
ncbi:transmembrane protein [Thalictrum thalictroides]|uniref:Transmembrane protein n=1 Tax=Thalictrum thalictroides TaxID=46969 RepID=A0A7J6V6D6_THATH|nr:transmembrane protein [Thalictrum thalictroides]